MLGTIAGDIIGSRFEHRVLKSVDFELWHPDCRLTDDTVMTIATADALLEDGDFSQAYHRWGNRYPHAGYGGAFRQWLASPEPLPYGSWGNGSAMRVSPVARVAGSEMEVLRLARATAVATHDHPRGIVGAQAVALAIWLARGGAGAEEIRRKVTEISGYDLGRTVERIRPGYKWDVSCDGSVPEAIICALEASSLEHAVRLAISLGGDADTQAAIAGGIAGAMWGVPPELESRVMAELPGEMVAVLERFVGGG